jgi:thiol-disulfide isomerase/thioredoxin
MSASQKARASTSSTHSQHARATGASSRRKSAGTRRKRSTALTAAIFGAVLVVAAILIIVLVSVTGNKTSSGPKGFGMKVAPASVVKAISNVSSATFAQAGTTISSTAGPYTGVITTLKKQSELTSGGKPEIVYVGSNWCPYCAATRWPLAIALARFGAFKNLRITASGRATGESYPGTSTLSFYKTTYTSRYISFLTDETCTDIVSSSTSASVEGCNGYLPLEPLKGEAETIFAKYDYPPYVSSTDQGTIPFLDFANVYLEDGAFMGPSILTDFSQLEIAQSLDNPNASPAQTMLSGANYYTAVICKLTHNQPASVCKMPVVKQAAVSLKL